MKTQNPSEKTSPALDTIDIQNLTNKELYALCKEYGKNTRKWARGFGFLLPEVARRHMYRKYRCTSIFEFAAKLAGMSHNITSRILNLSGKLEDKPLIWAEFQKYGWTKLTVIADIVTVDTQKFWLDKLRKLPKGALQSYINGYKKSEIKPINGKNPQSLFHNVPFESDEIQNSGIKEAKNAGTLELGNTITGGEFSKIEMGCQAASCEARLTNNPEAQNMITTNPVQHFRSQDAAIAGEPSLNPSRKLKFHVDAETEFEFKKFKQAMEKEKKESLTMGETLKLLLIKIKELESAKSQMAINTSDFMAPLKKTVTGHTAYDNSNNHANSDNTTSPERSHHRQDRHYIKLIATAIRDRTISQIKKSRPVSRQIPQKTQKSIIAAYRGKCAFSGCNEPYSELHHPDRFSLNKSHQRIYPLCRLHHQLAHAGLIKNEELTIENWEIDFEGEEMRKNPQTSTISPENFDIPALAGSREINNQTSSNPENKPIKLSKMENVFSMYRRIEKQRVDQMVRDHWQT